MLQLLCCNAVNAATPLLQRRECCNSLSSPPQVFYCSVECQTAAWKAHKPACQSSSEKLEVGDVVVADVTIAAPGFEGMQFMSIDLNAPVSRISRDRGSSDPERLHAPVPKGDGATSVIKIQVSAPCSSSRPPFALSPALSQMVAGTGY